MLVRLAAFALFLGALAGCAKPADGPARPTDNPVAKAAPKPADPPKSNTIRLGPDPKPDTPKVEPKAEPPKSDGSRSPGVDPLPDAPKDSPPPPAPVAGPRRVALLVGIAKYDSEVGDLLYSENDVNKLAEALKTGGYKADDVVVMTTTAGEKDRALLPTAANIHTKLNALAAGLRKDDLVLVAFAGHGVQPAADKAYFCAYQTKLADPKTMVAIDDVIAALNKSAATTKILLVDACRNTLARAPRPREDAVTDLPTVTGRDGTATIAYFSCDKGEKSWEVDELKHGVFFAQVIDALGGSADTYPDGQVTWGEMVDYVQRNINFHNSKFEAKKQTPHFRGEVRNAAPIVVRAAPGKVDTGRAAPAAATVSADAVNEDFRAVESGSLPRGWAGPAFVRTYDEKASRPCLELRRKEGKHALNIPLGKPLAGNFAVEIEFRLAGLTNIYYQTHGLSLALEGEGGQIVPVVIEHDGKVTFADAQPRATEKFKANEINRLKLVRSGDSYTLFLNDGDAASTRISYTGQINGLRIGSSHRWFGDPDRAPNLTTRLYSIKAGSVKPGDPAKVGKVILDENFHTRAAGAVLPDGWQGNAFSVATDERYDLKALEVNKAESQIYWVTVPKQDEALGKGRGFALDLDVRLCGYDDRSYFYSDRAQGQEVFLRLEGPGALPLTVALDPYGRVRLSGEKEQKAKWFTENSTNRLRLIAQNGAVQVLVNGVTVVESKRPAGNYAEFSIGMIGGVPRVSHGFSAKLYGVRLTALPGDEPKLTPLRVVAEDFLRVPAGGGPKDWGGTNVAVRPGDGRYGNLVGLPTLQLTDTEKAGVVSIPFKPYDLKLDGDFSAALEFVHTDNLHHDVIGFGLHGAGKGQSLEVALFYRDSKFLLQAKAGATAFPAANVTQIVDNGKPCVIGIERSGAAVAITLNGQPVGNIPAGKVPHVYEGAAINLSTDRKHSPHVTRVFVAAK